MEIIMPKRSKRQKKNKRPRKKYRQRDRQSTSRSITARREREESSKLSKDIEVIPPEILLMIFYKMTTHTILTVLPLVCKQWNAVLNHRNFLNKIDRHIQKQKQKTNTLISDNEHEKDSQGEFLDRKTLWGIYIRKIPFEGIANLISFINVSNRTQYGTETRKTTLHTAVKIPKINLTWLDALMFYKEGHSEALELHRGGGVSALLTLFPGSGDDVNAVDEDGETPLFNAVRVGNLEVVRLLIKRKADCTVTNKQGRDLLSLARAWRAHKPEIFKEIEKQIRVQAKLNKPIEKIERKTYGKGATGSFFYHAQPLNSQDSSSSEDESDYEDDAYDDYCRYGW